MQTRTTAVPSAVTKKLETLREKGAMRNAEVANLLGTRPETVSRWNQGRAYPHAKTEKMLLELEYVIDQLSDFYEPNEARQWIFAPQKLLDGESPAELIRANRMDEIMRLVRQLGEAVHFYTLRCLELGHDSRSGGCPINYAHDHLNSTRERSSGQSRP